MCSVFPNKNEFARFQQKDGGMWCREKMLILPPKLSGFLLDFDLFLEGFGLFPDLETRPIRRSAREH